MRSNEMFRKAVLGSLSLLTACSTAHVSSPLTQSLGGNAASERGEFWYQLAQRPITSNDDAFHALLLYMDGKDANAGYASRVKDLKSRQMLPTDFAGNADQAVDRGTLAVALDKHLKIQGGLTMQLLGPSPRYALRAAVDRGIFPPSSPNQGITGGEFVGIMQKAEEFENGDPSNQPVNIGPIPPALAENIRPPMFADNAGSAVLRRAGALDDQPVSSEYLRTGVEDPAHFSKIDLHQLPYYFDAAASTSPTTKATTQPVHLKAYVISTQGDLVEIRSSPTAAWKQAGPGMVLREGTEIRTGPKSSIRFLIPKDEAFRLDSQGSITLSQAVINGRKAKTQIDLDHGRVGEDLSHYTPLPIEEAGLEHDTVIKNPHCALSLRGTKVSLFEQPSFEPIAVSLTGQAIFTNTDGLRIPFGGQTHVVIVGNQTSPADEAEARATSVGAGNLARLDFEERELAIVSQRGGFQRGDVIVGDLSVNDFKTLPGTLDFVLQWTGAPQQSLNSLNLAVFSPNDPKNNPNATARDYVADPPFTYALNPNSPATKEIRDTLYPQTSPSGGQITADSLGPNGLELAFWPGNYPTGKYGVVVYNLVDALHPPANPVDPVTYTINVYLNNTKIFNQVTGTVGQLQTSPYYVFNVSGPTTGSSLKTASITSGTNPLASTSVKTTHKKTH